MTCMFDQAVIMQEEIRWWSLLGLKGQIQSEGKNSESLPVNFVQHPY